MCHCVCVEIRGHPRVSVFAFHIVPDRISSSLAVDFRDSVASALHFLVGKWALYVFCCVWLFYGFCESEFRSSDLDGKQLYPWSHFSSPHISALKKVKVLYLLKMNQKLSSIC